MALTVASTAEGSSINWELQTGSCSNKELSVWERDKLSTIS